ncbi:DMT family transporter [Aureitalea marina]|uniref:Uncharacterized protein n=1 Tax=Aureitalea marina TaxID=930804 RepID=A0A2S7KN12_9FLAO|nr:DMT family transporter [Aureitalea marina]PQB04016.1 hypothetical protein BST85_03185 [Aureitalea marina]
MIYLLLSVLSSTTLFVVFKLFERFNVKLLPAIVGNYITAFSLGMLVNPVVPGLGEITEKPWFLYAISLGVVFIVVFNLMGMTTQRHGLSVVSVATKMSLIVPILFGLIYYKESMSAGKIAGIVLALIAVYMTTTNPRTAQGMGLRSVLLPTLVFLGSGFIDTSLKYLEQRFVDPEEVALFSGIIFGGAAIIGLLILLYRYLRFRELPKLRDALGGLALGIPNFFSVYFLVRTLQSDFMPSSGIFTLNNVAIVLSSTLLGILLFKELLSRRNWVGVLLAVISIIAVSLL